MTVSELTGQAKKLLEAIRNADGWQRRSQIAELIGKNRLTPYDIDLIEKLADMGLIEKERREVPGFIDHMFVYRADAD